VSDQRARLDEDFEGWAVVLTYANGGKAVAFTNADNADASCFSQRCPYGVYPLAVATSKSAAEQMKSSVHGDTKTVEPIRIRFERRDIKPKGRKR